MRYRWLGKTGFKVSEIGFGAWAIGGDAWGPQDDRDSRLALHKSLDMGCNFIDTAWAYGEGHSERLIGSVLKDRGERPVIATKVPPKNWVWDENRSDTPLSDVFTPEWVTTKAEESLRNLGVNCLDVLQLHTWVREWGSQAEPVLAAAARLKREGKIRAFGISLRDKGSDEANDLIRLKQVDTLQIFFNLFYQESIREVFPLVEKYGVGVIARVPLAFGALSGRFTAKTRFASNDHRGGLYEGEGLKTTLRKVEKLEFLRTRTMPLAEAALKWTLAYPAVSTSIPGIRNLRQALLNCAAGDGPALPTAAVKKAEKLYRSNFGLPVRTVPDTLEVPAILMSGVRRTVKKSERPPKRSQRRAKKRRK
jgi:aryl-alcohol dehydrogenase-like predicted oxidoreductase